MLLPLTLYNKSLYVYNLFVFFFSFRVVGIFRMVLQRLINEHHLDITDSLVDNNNTVLKVWFSSRISVI